MSDDIITTRNPNGTITTAMNLRKWLTGGYEEQFEREHIECAKRVGELVAKMAYERERIAMEALLKP